MRVSEFDSQQDGPQETPDTEDARKRALRLSAYVASKRDPERWGKVLKISGKADLPPEVVDRNFDRVHALSNDPLDGLAGEMVKRTPRTAEWASNEDNLTVTQDSLKELAQLERKFKRLHGNLRPLSDEEITEAGKRAVEDASDVMLDQYASFNIGVPRDAYGTPVSRDAIKKHMLESYIRERKAEEADIARTDEIGFFESIRVPLPFVRTALNAAKAMDLYRDAKAYRSGTASPAQIDRLVRYGRLEEAAADRGTSVLADIGDIVTGSVEFGAELAATGGIYRAGSAGVQSLVQGALKDVLKGTTRGIIRKSLGAMGGAALQLPVARAGAIAQETASRMTGTVGVTQKESGELAPILADDGDSFMPALLKAAGSQYVEILSERMGGIVERPIGRLKEAVIGKWLNLHPNKTVTDALKKIKKSTGWHGILGEVFEERVGEVMKAPIDGYRPPTAKQLATEIAAFSVPTLGHAALSFAANRMSLQDQAGQAKAIADHMKQIGVIATDNKAFVRAPDMVEAAVAAQTKDTPAEFLYVPAKETVEYLRDQKDDDGVLLDPKAFVVDTLGVSEESYDEAVKAGGVFRIPTAKYISKIVPSKHDTFFLNEMKRDPLEMSVRETKDALKEAATDKADPEGKLTEALTGDPFFTSAKILGATDKDAESHAKLRQAIRKKTESGLIANRKAEIKRQEEPWWKEERKLVRAEVERAVNSSREYRTLAGLEFGQDPNGKPVAGIEGGLKLNRNSIDSETLKHIPAKYLAEGRVADKSIAELKRALDGYDVTGKITENDFIEIVNDSITDISDAKTRSSIQKAIDKYRDAVEEDADLGGRGDTAAEFEAVRAKVEKYLQKAEKLSNKLPKGGYSADEAAGLLNLSTGRELLDIIMTYGGTDKESVIDQRADQAMLERYPEASDEQVNAEAEKLVHSEDYRKLLRMEIEILAKTNPRALISEAGRFAARIPRQEIVTQEAKLAIGRMRLSEVDPRQYQAAERKAGREAIALFKKGDREGAILAKIRQLVAEERYQEAVARREAVKKKLVEFRALNKSDKSLAERRDVGLINAARAVLGAFGLTRKQEDAQTYLSQMKQYDEEGYNTIMTMVNDATVGAKHYKQITFDQFDQMAEVVDGLWDLSLRNRQMEIRGQKEDLAAIHETLGKRLAALSGDRRLTDGYTRDKTNWDKAKLGLLGTAAGLRRVEPWVSAMDAGDPHQSFRRYVYEPIIQATTAYRVEKLALLKKYREIVGKLKGEYKGAEIVAPELKHIFANFGQLLHAILHRGNESNFSKLLRGRKWGDYREDGTLDASRWDAFEARMQREGILQKRHYDWAQQIWDLLESMKDGAQKAHKSLYGRYFKEVTANQFNTPWGNYRGGYVPAKVDPTLSTDQALREDKEAIKMEPMSFVFPSTGIGFTKTRNEAYAEPLMLDIRSLGAHIDWVMRFTHIQPAVRDVGRLVTDREFRKSLDAFDPVAANEMLLPWLQRSAQQKIEQQSRGHGGRFIDSIFRHLRKATALNIMFASVTNALQNATGFSVAKSRVRPGYLRTALWGFIRHPKDFSKMVVDSSDYMRTRTTEQVAQLQGNINEILLDPTLWEKGQILSQKHGYFMQVGTQNVVDHIVWTASYNDATEQGKSHEDAVLHADSTVRETQGSGAPEDLSKYEAGTPFERLFTVFSSYWNMKANLQATELLKASRDMGISNSKARLLYVYMMTAFIPAALSTLIYRAIAGKLGSDDDDDGYMDDAMQMFFWGQLQDAASEIPFGGQFLRLLKSGHSDPSPAVKMMEKAAGALSSVPKAIDGEGSSSKAITDLFTLIGLVTGLPVAPLTKPLEYVGEK